MTVLTGNLVVLHPLWKNIFAALLDALNYIYSELVKNISLLSHYFSYRIFIRLTWC